MKVVAFVPWVGIGLLTLAAASGAQPAIYRCVDAGGVVYTDRPCEGGADPHKIDDSRVTVYASPPGAGSSATANVGKAKAGKAKPKTDKRSKAGRAADADRHRARCAKLDQGLRDVRTKMRAGYGAKEGERLQARQRQLNQQRRMQKCG